MRVILLIFLFLAAIPCLDVLIFRHVVRLQNTASTHFDAIIVLGCPAERDGTLSAGQRTRTIEAVREFQRGVAPHIIFTGGAAHNQFVEAQTMAVYAQSQGVPASAISIESRAKDTLQNADDSVRIMLSNGWQSAEIISTPDHIYRAAFIFSHTSIAWSMHPAPWPDGYTYRLIAMHHAVEGLKTIRLQLLMLTSHPFQGLDHSGS